MLMRPSEVKRYYKLSHTTLFALEKEGKLNPSFTDGGHRRYHKKEIDDLLQVGVKDSIGYALEFCFEDMSKMPDQIVILGNDKPTFNEEGLSVWSDCPKMDSDTMPVARIHIYKRLNYDDPHPTVREQMKVLPLRTLVFANGGKDFCITEKIYCPYSVNAKDFGQESIVLSMFDIVKSLDFDISSISDESPCYITSMEVQKITPDRPYKPEEVVWRWTRIVYELVSSE